MTLWDGLARLEATLLRLSTNQPCSGDPAAPCRNPQLLFFKLRGVVSGSHSEVMLALIRPRRTKYPGTTYIRYVQYGGR